MSSLGRFW